MVISMISSDELNLFFQYHTSPVKAGIVYSLPVKNIVQEMAKHDKTNSDDHCNWSPATTSK